jgi:predicted ChrR family anti-sigma factor
MANEPTEPSDPLETLFDVVPVPPPARVRAELLLLAQAPALPVALDSYAWQEIAPGVRVHRLDVPEPGLETHLVWARAGAIHPRHRHEGDEVALVLQGRFVDDGGSYGAGDICRSGAGSFHTAEFATGDDCICYVLCYDAPDAPARPR